MTKIEERLLAGAIICALWLIGSGGRSRPSAAMRLVLIAGLSGLLWLLIVSVVLHIAHR